MCKVDVSWLVFVVVCYQCMVVVDDVYWQVVVKCFVVGDEVGFDVEILLCVVWGQVEVYEYFVEDEYDVVCCVNFV